MGRAEEFIQLFNRVEVFLTGFVNPPKYLPFSNLVDTVAKNNASVQANAAALKQFAKLRNAIVHDSDFPPQIIAMPSQEALSKFIRVAQEVLTPEPLIPKFEAQVICFSLNDFLTTVLEFMKKNDYSQIIVRDDDRKLGMITTESITKWLADNIDAIQNPVENVKLCSIIALEPSGSFRIMGSDKTIYDAVDTFRNAFQCDGDRLFAIVITKNGDEAEAPIGFITPWDLINKHQ